MTIVMGTIKFLLLIEDSILNSFYQHVDELVALHGQRNILLRGS